MSWSHILWSHALFSHLVERNPGLTALYLFYKAALINISIIHSDM